jgi:hypothetical protein
VDGTPQPQSSESGGKTSQSQWGCLAGIAAALAFFFVIGFCLGPSDGGSHKKGPQSSCVQTAHALGLALYSYANDNNGLYPDGTSSTEVFQQLMDGGYVTDPEIFYVAMDGKTKAAPTQKKLKPENVCWDVTGGLSLKDRGELPLIFLTGYRITYGPDGGVEPVIKPFPPYMELGGGACLAVFFVNNSAAWVSDQMPNGTYNFSMEHLLPSDFDAHGKTYRQLTPDGVLR